MNPLTHTAIWRLAKVGIVMLAALGFSQGAFATTAADHVIRNIVTVNYDDAGGTAQSAETAFVNITINLVEAAPNQVSTTTDVLDPVSTNSSVTLTYDVTSTSNGLDTYSIDTPVLGGAVTGASTSGASTAVSLGGSSVAAAVASLETGTVTAGSGTDITVPADSDGSDASLNGFIIGDRIVLDPGTKNIECEVLSITQPAAGTEFNKTATIEVHKCASTDTFAVGDQIGERAEFSVTVNTGTDTGNLTVDFNIESDSDPAQQTAVTQVTVVVVAANLDVFKFVRNVSTAGNNPTCGSTQTFECLTIQGGSEYYSSGVTADPGNTLEYAILLYNVSAEVTDIRGTDPLVIFTQYVDNSSRLIAQAVAEHSAGSNNCHTTNGTCKVDDGAGGTPTTTTPTDDDVSADDFVFLNTTPDPDELQFSAGHDGAGNPPASETPGNGGKLTTSTGTTNQVSVFTFQVTVDN